MIMMTGVVALSSFFLCEDDSAIEDDDFEAFRFIANFVTVQTCSGTSPLLSFVIFLVAVLPWLLLIASFVFSNSATTIVGLITAAAAGIAAFIGGLF